MKTICRSIMNNKALIMFILFISQFLMTGLGGVFRIVQPILLYLMIKVAFMEDYYEES